MLDPENVTLKFKKNAKQTHTIAYCDEIPEIQGIGPSEGHAIANFWKAFNNLDSKIEHEKTVSKKDTKQAA